MRTLVLSLLLTLPAFAISNGGHGGNGGNGCYDPVMQRYKSAEEMNGAPSWSRIPIVPTLRFNGSKQFTALALDGQHPVVANARQQIGLVREKYPHLGATLEQLFGLFNRVHILKGKTIFGVYNPSPVEEMVCPPPMTLRPVILMYADGSLAFIDRTWNMASSVSQQIFLVHETLRFLQILHPAGAMPTVDLLDLNRAIFRLPRSSSGSSLLEKYEEKLARFVPREVAPGEYEAHLATGKLDQALRSVVMAALASGSDVGEAMNRVRIHDKRFRDLADRRLRNALLK